MSGPTLFDLIGEYRAAAERLADLDLDEQTVADTLEGLTGEIEAKAQGVAHVVLNFEATADAIKQHAEKQLARAKAIRSRADSLRSYAARALQTAGVQRVDGPGVRLSFRKSQAVVIDGEDLLPSDFMRQSPPPPPTPDKVRIAAALKAGVDVPGAHFEQRSTLQIA